MNWFSLLLPIAVEILKRLADRKTGVQKMGVAADAAEKSWCSQQADQLEATLKQQPKEAAVEGGLIQQITDLVTALRSGDLIQALRILFEIFAGSPINLPKTA